MSLPVPDWVPDFVTDIYGTGILETTSDDFPTDSADWPEYYETHSWPENTDYYAGTDFLNFYSTADSGALSTYEAAALSFHSKYSTGYSNLADYGSDAALLLSAYSQLYSDMLPTTTETKSATTVSAGHSTTTGVHSTTAPSSGVSGSSQNTAEITSVTTKRSSSSVSSSTKPTNSGTSSSDSPAQSDSASAASSSSTTSSNAGVAREPTGSWKKRTALCALVGASFLWNFL